ncbi:MAG: GntR family transcriptional regulator [Alicyclobacillus sp.]|nr:GntR family transcriptional regulator [Alicyclobacillus sp.]
MSQFRFKPQKDASLRQRVTAEIRDAIVYGMLKPGERLREVEIAQQMGISRGPVREAIRDLEAMGLVVSLPYKETVVVDIRKEEVIGLLMPIRLHLELYCIRHGTGQYQEAFYQRIEQILADMRRSVEQKDLYGIVESDIQFHEWIIDSAGLAFPKQVWNSLVNRIRIHFIRNIHMYRDLNRLLDDHRRLASALRNGDWPDIERVWTDHIETEEALMFD